MAIENHELVDIIKKRQGKISLRTFAKSIGLTAAYLSDVYRGNRPVGPKLAEAMGYTVFKEEHITFRRKSK